MTGRPVEIVQQFCKRAYLPCPHVVMGDHGTHIVDGNNFNIIDDIKIARDNESIQQCLSKFI